MELQNKGEKIKFLLNSVALFSQLYSAMQCRESDLKEVFAHKIQSFPPSLSDLGNIVHCINTFETIPTKFCISYIQG